ncbi:hypothetical protein [Nocardioides sp.]|uniref:hypothetical protein n=1 Tax=Nocardioides sp. TaxID=35761 RepID=UPI003562205B
MPVGDCERAFAQAAAQDGIVLQRARVPWLNQRGHLGLPPEAAGVVELMQSIFDTLDGDLVAQGAKRLTSLPGDFVHAPTGTFIEIDEAQHFTSYRRLTLLLYPEDAPLGFSLEHYLSLCERLAPRSDRYRSDKAAVGFGKRGRGRQRAYHDALRDLVTPALGSPAVIRVAAPESDGELAYARGRDALQALHQAP